MEVIDIEDQLWALLQRNDALFLDVFCEHSAVSYNVLIELDSVERQAFLDSGRAYLAQFAEHIRYSAPGVLGNTSPYKARNVMRFYSGEVAEALEVWYDHARALPPN